MAASAVLADRPGMMRAVVDHWLAARQPDGTLPYGMDFFANQPVAPSRDPAAALLAQAEALRALAEYYRHSRDARVEPVLRQGIDTLRERSLPIGKGRVQGWLEQARVLDVPVGRWKLQSALRRLGWLYAPEGPGRVVAANGSYGSASATVTALALLAEIAYAQTSGDLRFAAVRAAWAQGLVALRIPSGGVRDSPLSIDAPHAANGTAWEALAAYVAMHPSEAAVAEIVEDLDAVLIDTYRETPRPQFIHRGLAAAGLRVATRSSPKLVTFIQQQSHHMLADLSRQGVKNDANCPGTASLAEGLAAMDASGAGSSVHADRVRRWLHPQLERLPQLQIGPDQTRLDLSGDVYLVAPRMAQWRGAFLRGLHDPVTFVDLTADCLLALVSVERRGVARLH